MTHRTDCHRPSAFNHDDYSFVAFGTYREEIDDLADIVAVEQRKVIDKFCEKTGATWSNHEHGGMCHVCGACFLDYCVFYHRPTNTLIKVGNDCATQIQNGNPVAGYDKFRTKVKNAIKNKAGILKAIEIMKIQNQETRIIRDNNGNRIKVKEQSFEESVISDMYGKLIRYGSLTEKQWSFMQVCVEKHKINLQREADQAAERAMRPDIPAALLSGRNRIEGEIIAMKEIDSQYGFTTKVLVRDDYGWVVWGTLPSAIDNASRGDRIAFNAVVSNGDERGFGFFSRPTKPEIVSKAEV